MAKLKAKKVWRAWCEFYEGTTPMIYDVDSIIGTNRRKLEQGKGDDGVIRRVEIRLCKIKKGT